MTEPSKCKTIASYKLCRRNNRRGVIFYIVLAVVTIMSIFILFYQNFSRHLAFSSFYHVNREKIRNLTEVILDSAFSHVQISTRDPNDTLTRQLVDQMKTTAINNTPFPLQAPLFEAQKSSLLGGASLNYKLTGRVFDKRTLSPQNFKYHPGEGLGTLEISVDATLQTPSGKILAKCQRVRHYDLRTSCLVSNYTRRQNSYAMSFPLDFQLLVRNGLREFKEGNRGQSFNDGLKLTLQDQSSIPASRRGLVYFGQADTNSNSDRIFFNTSDDSGGSQSIIPSLPAATFEINQEECFRFQPDSENPNIRGLKGRFTMKVHPAARTGTPENQNESDARAVLSVVSSSARVDPKPAGISFGSFDKAYLDSILRGAISQRYLYVVEFAYDSSSAEIYDGSDWVPANADVQQHFDSKKTLTFPPEKILLTTAASLRLKASMERLKELETRVNPPISLMSDLVEDYLIYEGQSMQRTPPAETFQDSPKFFARNSSALSDITVTGGEGFRPFRHYTLCAARYFYVSDLEKNGVYDRKNGILNLRGIVSVESDHVSFTPPAGRDHIIIKGAGAILAPNGFTISCGMKRENPSRDLCILFTRKSNIRIATSDPIEASLLAFNDSNSASVIPSTPFNVVGAIGVDKLYLNRFPSSPSTLSFDPRLKTDSDADEIFSITISPWIRFDDMTFSKE